MNETIVQFLDLFFILNCPLQTLLGSLCICMNICFFMVDAATDMYVDFWFAIVLLLNFLFSDLVFCKFLCC